MFGYGLVYRKRFADWTMDEVATAPLVAHDRLRWALDRLTPVLDRQTVLTLSERLIATRTELERAENWDKTRALLRRFLVATSNVLAGYWTLAPWYRLGEAVASCRRELLLPATSLPDGWPSAAAALADAIRSLPAEALGQSETLRSIRKSADDYDLAHDLAEMHLALLQPTFWATWRDVYRNALRPIPAGLTGPGSRFEMTAVGLPGHAMNADIAWPLHQAFVREQSKDPLTKRLQDTRTIHAVDLALNSIVSALTDAPVLLFSPEGSKSVGYNGGIREASDNFLAWLKVFYELGGSSISESRGRKRAAATTNPLRVELRTSSNDRLLRSLVVTNPSPTGGSRLLFLEPVAISVGR